MSTLRRTRLIALAVAMHLAPIDVFGQSTRATPTPPGAERVATQRDAAAVQQEAFDAERREIERAHDEARNRRDADPARFVTETEAYLDRGERLAQSHAGDRQATLYRRDLADRAHRAATYARLTAHDGTAAIRLYRRSLALRPTLPGYPMTGAWSRIGIADTLRFDLHDTAGALAEYRVLLAELRAVRLRDEDQDAPVVKAMMQWAGVEIDSVATGHRFAGAVPIEAVMSVAIAIDFGTYGQNDDRPLEDVERVLVARSVEGDERKAFANRLETLSASQSRVLTTFNYLPVLGTPQRIARYLLRHDPTGFLTRAAFAALPVIEQEPKGNHVGMHVLSWSKADRALVHEAGRLMR